MEKLRNVESLIISTDEDSFCISATIELRKGSNWSLVSSGDEIRIDIGSTHFNFIVDNRSRSASFSGMSWRIEARSITAKMAEPFAIPIAREWENDSSAKVIVENLCNEYGISLQWNIIDWSISGGTLVADNEYPISIIRKIAEAAGAILQTTPEGVLVIQYKYPISPTKYENNAEDYSVSGTDDIINLDEDFEKRPEYDQVVVMDSESQDDRSWSLELIKLESETAHVALFIYPWLERSEFDFLHAGSSSIDYYYDGNFIGGIEDEEEISEIEEEITIIEGEGSVSSPVYDIISTSYNHRDLGTVSHNGTQITTSTQDESILTITYRSRYHKFRITNPELIKTLVYTEK